MSGKTTRDGKLLPGNGKGGGELETFYPPKLSSAKPRTALFLAVLCLVKPNRYIHASP